MVLGSCGEMRTGAIQLKRYRTESGAAAAPRPPSARTFVNGMRRVGLGGIDDRARARLQIDAAERAELLRVVQPAARGVGLVIHSVADADRHPIVDIDAARPAVGWTFPAFVVLQAAVDVIRLLHIDADRVELAELEIGEVIGGAAAVVRNGNAAVGSRDHVIGILGIDPEAAEIAERAGEGIAGAAASVDRARPTSCRRRWIGSCWSR